MTDPEIPVKLPVIATFIQVLAVMKERYIYFLKFSLPLVIFIVLIFVFGEFLATGLMGFIMMIAFMILISIVVVAYHRTFIMDIEDVNDTPIFRLAAREWRFIGWYFVIFFSAGILMALLMFMTSGFFKELENETKIIMSNFLALPIYYLLARWILVLPATSVDDEQASINFSWHLTQGNGWRLVVLVFLLPLIINILSNFLFSQGQIFLIIIAVILYLISLIVGVGVISLSYSYLKLHSSHRTLI